MSPDEFISFDEAKPQPNKHLIVTNNLHAKNAHGEMSHVWLTTFWTVGSKPHEGLVTFDEADNKIVGMTHWKYA